MTRKLSDRTAFFYGTLMAPEILHRVLYGHGLSSSPSHNPADLSSLTIAPALLHNYCRHRVLDADYPGMIAQAGASVRGTFVSGLTEDNVRNLDWFEGDQYERVGVQVVLLNKDGAEIEGSSGKREAETYVWKGEEGLEIGEWDYEVFRREKLGRWADTSSEYDEVDANMSMEDDGYDPTGGRGVRGTLMEELDMEDKEKKLESAV